MFAAFGFVASLTVHLATFFGINSAKYIPWVWVLHLGIFVAMIPLLIAQYKYKEGWPTLFRRLPRWAKITLPVFFGYALINFGMFFILSGGASPDVRDGKYVLHKHGQIIRELSEQEYDMQQAYVLRGFSGHWMVFYLVSALYCGYRKD